MRPGSHFRGFVPKRAPERGDDEVIRYYLGRGLQLLGLVLTAESLILYFGKMGPMMVLAAAGVGVFYAGRFISGKPR